MKVHLYLLNRAYTTRGNENKLYLFSIITQVIIEICASLGPDSLEGCQREKKAAARTGGSLVPG